MDVSAVEKRRNLKLKRFQYVCKFTLSKTLLAYQSNKQTRVLQTISLLCTNLTLLV
jgi:hypothetical protein